MLKSYFDANKIEAGCDEVGRVFSRSRSGGRCHLTETFQAELTK